VDRSFITQEGQEQRAAIILSSIVAMGHDLGLTVVAEGVESQEQVDRLGELGCDFGQGYFIGKPMTAKQVNDALAGLPYAFSSGRTAITWLWERGQKDPAPEAQLRPMTGRDLETPDTAAEPEAPARPMPRAPAASVTEEPAEPPAPEPESAPAAHEPEPAAAEDVPLPPPAEVLENNSLPVEEEPPPPAPRRRKGGRRAPALGDPVE